MVSGYDGGPPGAVEAMAVVDAERGAMEPPVEPAGPAPRVRPWRTYAWLVAVDVLILGALLVVAVGSGQWPTLAEFGPVATALTALVALNVGVVTVAQKRVADARSAWWARAQWALEGAISDEPRERVVGKFALIHLVRSDLITADDLALIRAIPEEVVGSLDSDPLTATMEVEIDLDPGASPVEES